MRRQLLLWATVGLAVILGGCAQPVQITPAALPDGAVGTSYGQNLTAAGGGDLQWTVGQGSLPPGLLLNSSSGVLAGMPLYAGTYQFTIIASDRGFGGERGRISYTIEIIARLTIAANLPAARVNQAYSQSVSAAGGVKPYTFKVLGLPAGMQFDATTGAITGTPLDANSGMPLQITVTDSGAPQQTATAAATFVVKGPAVSITTTSLPNATVGSTNYSATLQATGGKLPYTWSVIDGVLPSTPNGNSVLELNRTTGAISNSRNALGALNPVDGSQPSWTFTVQVTDGDTPATSATQQLTITVVQPAP